MAILTQEEMERKSTRLRSIGKRVVFTNGCFDLIHLGHIKILSEARAAGDCLFVGINSDESVRHIKGINRPIQKDSDRLAIVDAIKSVTDVTLFYEDTPEFLIRKIQPDVLVKGMDYEETKIVGADDVISRGGKILRVSLLENQSSTALMNRVVRFYRRKSLD